MFLHNAGHSIQCDVEYKLLPKLIPSVFFKRKTQTLNIIEIAKYLGITVGWGNCIEDTERRILKDALQSLVWNKVLENISEKDKYNNDVHPEVYKLNDYLYHKIKRN